MELKLFLCFDGDIYNLHTYHSMYICMYVVLIWGWMVLQSVNLPAGNL